MRNQKGLTLSGFMTWAIIVSFVALLGFKLGPAYWEDAMIQKHLRTVAKEDDSVINNRRSLENAFDSRATIDNITAISPKDIVVDKSGGRVMLSATYTTRIPIIYNINACLDFNPTSE